MGLRLRGDDDSKLTVMVAAPFAAQPFRGTVGRLEAVAPTGRYLKDTPGGHPMTDKPVVRFDVEDGFGVITIDY
ncbi:MAG: hypothetical protein AB7F78_15505, partial [Hyphomicrobiaceae bacterium]